MGAATHGYKAQEKRYIGRKNKSLWGRHGEFDVCMRNLSGGLQKIVRHQRKLRTENKELDLRVVIEQVDSSRPKRE